MRSIIIIPLLLIAMIGSATSLEYLLALERCEDAPPGDFTIHGLWPQYNQTSWPQFCNKSATFDYQALQPLMPQISKWWQTCQEFHHTEPWFLKHEWLKHGTCTPFTEVQYFGTGLALYQILPWAVQCPADVEQCLIEVTGIMTE
jgi:ribonuclease I